uniref:BCL6 corepressor n=1 Tax=Myripristis murdjan TaxID=586833 RepID=A0A667Y2Z3_9TELE
MQGCTPSWIWHTRPSSSSPSPKAKAEWSRSSPSDSDKVSLANKAGTHPSSVGKQTTTPVKPEGQDNPSCPENGNPSGQIYSDSYLPPSLAYTNRYIPYSVAENMSLPHITIPGKGPIYPHPVLLGSSSLYPPRLAPKHGLPYGIHPSQGDYLTYHNSQEMAHPLMSSHLGLDTKDRLENRSKPLDKPWNTESYRNQTIPETDNSHKSEKEADKPTNQILKSSSKSLATARDEVVCIDLVHDEPHGNLSIPKRSSPSARREDSSKHVGSGSSLTTPCFSASVSSSSFSSSYSFNIPRGPTCRHLSPANAVTGGFNKRPADMTAEPQVNRDLTCDILSCGEMGAKRQNQNPGITAASCMDEKMEAGCQDDVDSLPDEDEGQGGRARRSSLTKRIANSSGYVGDRFKCLTTELYADSSKLSREQRALQVSSHLGLFFYPAFFQTTLTFLI